MRTSPAVNLSVCVPAYNEEQCLESAVCDLLENVAPRVSALEIIIVDDASRDRTADVAQKLCRLYPDEVFFVRHESNRGIGGAFRSALGLAKMDYFTHFPADHENSAEEIASVLEMAGGNRVVTCHHRTSDPRPLVRRLLSGLYVRIFNLVSGLSLNYYNGLSIFPTGVLRAAGLKAEGFMFSAETLVRGRAAGLEIVEVASSVPLRGRVGGKSAALSARSVRQLVRDFIRVFIFRGGKGN